VRLLFDTHTLLWWDENKLPASTVKMVQRADDVFVSAVTAWQIAIKAGLGKLVARGTVADAIADYGFRALPISVEHADRVKTLPAIHRDPFDRESTHCSIGTLGSTRSTKCTSASFMRRPTLTAGSIDSFVDVDRGDCNESRNVPADDEHGLVSGGRLYGLNEVLRPRSARIIRATSFATRSGPRPDRMDSATGSVRGYDRDVAQHVCSRTRTLPTAAWIIV